MVETILSNPLFVEAILPFLLVFTIVFAILQKTRVLGEGKKQVDAIVALVIGLIVITFARAVGIILVLMPFLAVSMVIILVFLILYGMVFKEGEFKLPGKVQGVIGALAALAVIAISLWATGAWDYLLDMWTNSGDSSQILTNVIFVVVILAAVAIVVLPGRSDEKKKDDDE